jgi:hypothetical protein
MDLEVGGALISAQSAQNFAEAQQSICDKNDDLTTQLLSSVEVTS